MRAWHFLLIAVLIIAAFVVGAFCGALYVDREWSRHAAELEQRRRQESDQYRALIAQLADQEKLARERAEEMIENERESDDDGDGEAMGEPDNKPQTLITEGPGIELDREYAVGVTPENNGVVLFLRAYGPQIIQNPEFRAAYFERLEMPDPGDDGPFLALTDGAPNLDQAARQHSVEKISAAWAGPWKLDDQPEAARWLAANEAPLKLCVEAIQREKFYDPILVPEGETLNSARMYFVQFSREVPRLLAARAMNHIQEGRIDAALADAASIHRLSRLITQHPLLIPQLVAYSHVSFAALLDEAIIQSGQLTADQARRQRELLAALPEYPALADIIDRGDRRGTHDVLRELAGRQSLSWPGGVKERHDWIEETYDETVAACRLPDVKQRIAAVEAIKDRLRPHVVITSLKGDIKALDSFGLPVQPAVVVAEARMRIRLELIALGYALAEYHAQQGEYPAALDQLVPDLIDAVPNDSFADEAIGYQLDAAQKSFRVFSRGPNGQDDDATAGTDDINFGANLK